MGAEDVKKGDRVRVILEGEVGENRFSSFTVGSDALSTISHHPTGGLISVEVLKPPVETFKPGDRLRRKGGPGRFEVTLANSGYIQHFKDCSARFYEYHKGEQENFHSGRYELVIR